MKYKSDMFSHPYITWSFSVCLAVLICPAVLLLLTEGCICKLALQLYVYKPVFVQSLIKLHDNPCQSQSHSLSHSHTHTVQQQSSLECQLIFEQLPRHQSPAELLDFWPCPAAPGLFCLWGIQLAPVDFLKSFIVLICLIFDEWIFLYVFAKIVFGMLLCFLMLHHKPVLSSLWSLLGKRFKSFQKICSD